jgi:chromosome segregation ATPase
VARVERDVDTLSETVVRFERGVASEFDRVEQQLKVAIQRVEESVRTEIAEPAETMRRLDQELPEQLTGIERTVVQQLASTQRELSSAMSSLVDANRATLDRVTSLTSTLDDDRARRSEDVEVIVDTVTTGWEGLAGAIKALFEQNDELSRRIAGIEQRLTQIRDLEDAVEGTLGELRSHVKDLAPAPIVVTVSHPEAEVRNETRTGWSPSTTTD